MARRAPAPPIPRELMVKPIDAWWTVLFVDPVATRVVPPLVRVSWINPTRVTLAAHLLGVVSVALFAADALVAAAVVFEVRFLLDCIDGKIARATGTSSVLGQLLDSIGDRVLFTATVVAFGWPLSPIAVVILAAVYPLHFHLLEIRERLLSEQGEAKPIEKVMGGRWGQAMTRRRLFPMPTSVDFEHLLLFVAPVLWALGVDLLEPTLWLVTAYFALQAARYGLSMLRAAARLDRLRADDPQPAG